MNWEKEFFKFFSKIAELGTIFALSLLIYSIRYTLLPLLKNYRVSIFCGYTGFFILSADIRKGRVLKMKNKLVLALGVLLVFGFVLIGCDTGNDSVNPFVGTWTKENTPGFTVKIICTENTWVANVAIGEAVPSPYCSGTYTYSETAASFAFDSISSDAGYTGAFSVTVSNGKMIISGFTGDAADNVNGTYSK
ncbi:MAG: hypothetical protein LBU19_04450 [Treponema sp.]|jgi:hypothetical protein|nr:hypothetical protein [Treponema sp.]